jgi:hypothetical protein
VSVGSEVSWAVPAQNGEFWALRSLESEGLIITRPGGSAVVTLWKVVTLWNLYHTTPG